MRTDIRLPTGPTRTVALDAEQATVNVPSDGVVKTWSSISVSDDDTVGPGSRTSIEWPWPSVSEQDSL